jgi:hypothetical protein
MSAAPRLTWGLDFPGDFTAASCQSDIEPRQTSFLLRVSINMKARIQTSTHAQSMPPGELLITASFILWLYRLL